MGKREGMRRRAVLLLLAALALMSCLSGCGGQTQETGLAQPETARYGIISQTGRAWLAEHYPQADVGTFPSAADTFLALRNGKIDYAIISLVNVQYIQQTDAGVVIVKDDVAEDVCSIAVSKEEPQLREDLTAAIDKMEIDGSLQELVQRWMLTDPSSYTAVEVPEAEGTNGVIRVAISPDAAPICFMLDGEYAGIDIELIERIALILDKKIEYMNMEFDALLPALSSGRADIALSDIVDTPERRESVDFTREYFSNPQVMIAYRADLTVHEVGFWEGLQSSFERTFITENRWKLIADGLLVTLLIAACSGVLGTLLGFALCLLRRARSKALGRVGGVLVRIIQGIPVMVLLMLLYYVIFEKVDISAILVAILGFSVHFASYVAEMMRSGLNTVEPGQIEAATALGYSRFQVFWKVSFPQAARYFLPLYKGEFISMVKMTSVAGYIAVQDLTKVSDIIRGRTLEAFFPLIATAVLYFIIANLLTAALSLVEFRLDPQHRPRRVKGVTEK